MLSNRTLVIKKILMRRWRAFVFFLMLLLAGAITKLASRVIHFSDSPFQSQIIQLDIPAGYQADGQGGLISADVNDDGETDFLVTQSGKVMAYEADGKKLWNKAISIQLTQKLERDGLPGLHAPGLQAGDVDGDGNTEVVFLTQDNALHIIDGASGESKKTIALSSPEGADRWEHLAIANFRGQGDRDLLLQATNSGKYRVGRFLAAYAFEDLLESDKPQPLWARDDFKGSAHSGARIADLDGDGKDEVLGGSVVSADGEMLLRLLVDGHIDGLSVTDVRPDLPGLEVVALEEGEKNRVFLYGRDRIIWETDYKRQEPQNAAVGDFDPERPGLEIWCRSRYNEDQKPFVFDAQGELISEYVINRVSPFGWTKKGVEVIFTLDWTGDPKQLAAAKERHESGDVAIFDPISGKFLARFPERADRLYVADVSGDWREELIILNGNQLRIYSNADPNPNPNKPRLWTFDRYRRSKMTWNYYNP